MRLLSRAARDSLASSSSSSGGVSGRYWRGRWKLCIRVSDRLGRRVPTARWRAVEIGGRTGGDDVETEGRVPPDVAGRDSAFCGTMIELRREGMFESSVLMLRRLVKLDNRRILFRIFEYDLSYEPKDSTDCWGLVTKGALNRDGIAGEVGRSICCSLELHDVGRVDSEAREGSVEVSCRLEETVSSDTLFVMRSRLGFASSGTLRPKSCAVRRKCSSSSLSVFPLSSTSTFL